MNNLKKALLLFLISVHGFWRVKDTGKTFGNWC